MSTEFLTRSRNQRRYREVEIFDPDTGEIVKQSLDHRFEYVDPIPVEIPIALRSPESTDDRIRRLMNENRMWTLYAERAEETFDDGQDFDIEEQQEFASEYEIDDGMLRRFNRRLTALIDAGEVPPPDGDPPTPDDEEPLEEPPEAPADPPKRTLRK